MNKTLSLSLSLSLLSTVAFAAPSTPPGEAEPYTQLPANLTKGVNLPYIAGNAGFWHVNDLRPYDADRISALLTPADFVAIKAAGFNHIRFPIDPACVGADPVTGAINPSMFTSANFIPPTNVRSNAGLNILAIKETITEAVDAGLAVIIDLHPNYLNEAHRQTVRRLDPNVYIPYDSIFKKELVLLGTPPLTVNHPLAKFWDTFLDHIAHPGSTADANPGKVYFEIMNEPLIDFAQERVGPVGDWTTVWKPWFNQSIANWKAVQLNALQVCLAKKPNHKFIVTTAMADTADFGENYTTGNGNWAINNPQLPLYAQTIPSFGTKYSASQLGGVQNHSRVIYTAHLYSPFDFTHYTAGESDLEGEFYDLHPDQSGLPRNATTPIPAEWDSMYPRLNEVATWITKQTTEDVVEGGLTMINPPPVLLTEMGVNKRNGCEPSEPTLCTLPTVTANWIPKNPHNDAYVWHWDARLKLQSMGVGWTVYEWIGPMGVSFMTRVHSSLGGTRRIHGHPLLANGANGTWQLRPEFGYALFGTPFSDGAGTELKARGGRED